MIVNRQRFAELVGISLPTVTAWIEDGMPVKARGRRGRAWKIDSAAAIAWVRERDRRAEYAPAHIRGRPAIPDVVRRLAAFFLAPGEREWFPWDSGAVTLEEYARSQDLDVKDLLDWATWGLPLLPATSADESLRISPWHAGRWRALMAVFIETAGGDGHGDIGEEMHKLLGIAPSRAA